MSARRAAQPGPPGGPLRRWAAVLTTLLVATVVACTAPAPTLVLFNGRIFTADPERPWAEALAIRGQRVVDVGTTEAVTAQAGRGATRRDLGGRTVLPGFNDAHADDPGLPAAGLRAVAAKAVAEGVTSRQLFSGTRPVRDTATALVDADLPLRVRVFRMPRPGPGGETIDSRPHLPPQPAPRLDIRGMAFRLGRGDLDRITQAVGWAYGTEDLLAIEPADAAALRHYVEAVEKSGVAEIWARKRPRLERPDAAATAMADRIRARGMVVVQRPDGAVPLGSLVRHGVPFALAFNGRSPFAALVWATSPERGGEALSMEQAVTAMTRGAAFAELADRDKGHLSVGALADLVVASADPFTAGAEQLAGARSVLTIIGGRTVHDVP